MKRWVKAGRSGLGVTVVTVTLQEGNISAKWAVKSTAGHIKDSVLDADRYAKAALADMQAAVAQLEGQEA